MTTVLSRGHQENGRAHNQDTGRRARLTTTLYDLITVLQAEEPAADDQGVVATVAHLLQTGRLTWDKVVRIT